MRVNWKDVRARLDVDRFSIVTCKTATQDKQTNKGQKKKKDKKERKRLTTLDLCDFTQATILDCA